MEQKTLLIAIALAGGLYIAGQYVASQPVRDAGNSLTVQATGKATSTPDVGHIVLGVQVQPQQTAEAATDMLAKQTNTVIASLEKLGIEKNDVTTQTFSVTPSYDYRDGRQSLRGYEAVQQLDVTVRKTDQAEEIIARTTEAGANQVGGLTFKSDDPEVAQLAAEKDAIANARNKAEELVQALGARLGKVKNYNVQQGYGGGPIPYALEAKGMGGDSSVTPPRIPVGTQESTVTVTVTYELR